MRRRREAVIVTSLVAVMVVFFFVPLVTLPLAVALQPAPCGSACLYAVPYGISVSRVVSPSLVLLGFGGVYYQGHIGVTEPFNYSSPYSYRFTWNSSDLSQFTAGLYYFFPASPLAGPSPPGPFLYSSFQGLFGDLSPF